MQISLKKNFIMNSILTMSTFIFPLITFPYISRVLLPAGMGKIAFATSIMAYFAMFAQLGIPTYGIRACAKVRDNREKLTKIVQELLIINLIMTLFAYSIFAVLLIFLTKFQDEKTLLILMSSTLFFNLIGAEWLYKGLEQYTYITVRSILFKFIAVIAMLLLIHQKEDYILYGAISIFASSASNVLNFFNLRHYIDFKKLKSYNLKQHLSYILVFFAMSCATIIYTNLDAVMIGFMQSDQDVGYYSAAIKIRTLLLSFVTSLGAVLLPRASYYIEHNLLDKFYEISQKAMHFVLLVSIPITFYFILYAKEGILFLSGSDFTPAILAMQIIMPTVILVGITNITGIQMLVPMGKEKIVLYSVSIGAIVNLLLNSFLIHFYSYIGAAIATTVAEIAVLLVQYWYLKDILQQKIKHIPIFNILIATLIASVFGFAMKLIEVSVFWKLTCSASVFFAIYIIILLLFKERLMVELTQQILKKLKKR